MPAGEYLGAVSIPEYLASWLNRYPSDRAWVDDGANFALRQSEAAWLNALRVKSGLGREDMEQLVMWKFGWAAARRQRLDAVRSDRYAVTARIVKEAITQGREHPDDDSTAARMIVSAV